MLNFSQETSDALLMLVELPKFLLPGHPEQAQGSAQGTEFDRAQGAAGKSFRSCGLILAK